MGTLFLLLLAGVIGFIVIRAINRRAKRGPATRSDHLCRIFGLDSEEYALLGSDLGDGADKVWLEEDGLVGIPDAVFEHLPSGDIVVGEAKSRYFRGHITDYERFQLTLYMGMVARSYGVPVAGFLRFGCGKVIPFDCDVELYRSLLDAVPDCDVALMERDGFPFADRLDG